MLTCTLDCTSGGARSASRALWLYHQADRTLFCWQVTPWAQPFMWKSLPRRGICFTTKSPCTFTVLTQVKEVGSGVICFYSKEATRAESPLQDEPGDSQDQGQPLSPCLHIMGPVKPLSWWEAGYFSSYDKSSVSRKKFLPGIVHAVWETSLKQIGKRLLLFCQYKPCLH